MFFKIGNVIGLLPVVTGASRELAIAHSPQLPPKREARDRQAELVPYPLRQIDKPPAHYTMSRRDRASVDGGVKCPGTDI